jgi:hypothetical protein
LTEALNLLVSLGMSTLVVALIYQYMPARRLAWKAVLYGALVTALLFHAGRWAIGSYLGHVHRALGLRCCGVVRRFAAVALLFSADISVRRRVYRLPQRFARGGRRRLSRQSSRFSSRIGRVRIRLPVA